MTPSCLMAASSLLVAYGVIGGEPPRWSPASPFPIPCLYVETAVVDQVPVYALVCPLKMRLEPPPIPPLQKHQRRLE